MRFWCISSIVYLLFMQMNFMTRMTIHHLVRVFQNSHNGASCLSETRRAMHHYNMVVVFQISITATRLRALRDSLCHWRREEWAFPAPHVYVVICIMFVICTYVFGYQLPLSNLLIYVPPIIGQCGFRFLTLNFYPQSYIFLLCHIVCIINIYVCMDGWNKSLSLSLSLSHVIRIISEDVWSRSHINTYTNIYHAGKMWVKWIQLNGCIILGDVCVHVADANADQSLAGHTWCLIGSLKHSFGDMNCRSSQNNWCILSSFGDLGNTQVEITKLDENRFLKVIMTSPPRRGEGHIISDCAVHVTTKMRWRTYCQWRVLSWIMSPICS